MRLIRLQPFLSNVLGFRLYEHKPPNLVQKRLQFPAVSFKPESYLPSASKGQGRHPDLSVIEQTI